MSTIASSADTHTFYLSRDFFGVACEAFLRGLTDSNRVKRRTNFNQLRVLCKALGLVSNKEDILFITIGSDHVGKEMILITCKHKAIADGKFSQGSQGEE